MTGDRDLAPSPDRARESSWGGPGVRAELRRIADDAARRAGFRVCAIEVLRADGLLELVAFTGSGPDEAPRTGESYSLDHIRQVLSEGARYGEFVFLAEEEMDADLQQTLRGHGYVPQVVNVDDPERWRSLDMLVAALKDSDRIRALLHLDAPISGRRPRPDEMHDIAIRLELALQAVLATVDRDELTRRARLDETARAMVRAASQRPEGGDLLAHVHAALMAGFRARSVAVLLYDTNGDSPGDTVDAAVLPSSLRPAIEAATRRAWQSRTVIIAEPGRVWGDDQLESDHLEDLTHHLVAHAAGELLLVPVGAGPEAMGVLVVVRDGLADRWTASESQAALGVGHDLGRALLSTRAHEREQQLIDQLQRLDDYRQKLIATVSHELKNPLGMIVGHVEMLQDVAGLPTAAATSLDALGRGTSRLTSLIDDLLLLSRVSNVDSPMSDAPVDLCDVLIEVAEDESLRAMQQGVNLLVDTPGGSPSVAGEREELRQVMANVVSNAVKYSRSGGTVTVSLEDHGEEVAFVCADNGLGISHDDQRQLFTEFYRSTNPEALRRPGTGLGLAIVSRIVTRHGGRTEVESSLGRGTTFRVVLPRVRR
jgi:two-component system phosphate regulon sensor histidine kinase PhoR